MLTNRHTFTPCAADPDEGLELRVCSLCSDSEEDFSEPEDSDFDEVNSPPTRPKVRNAANRCA